MPKVSVIVPVYNGEAYLTQCLESLIAQTLEDIEIICVDNCSTDGTPEILSLYAEQDKRVRIIRQDRNRGQGDSVNKGWYAASGEYIAECDADDCAMPNMYETLYNRSQGADVVWGGWYDVNGNERIRRGAGASQDAFKPMDLDRASRFRFLQFQPHILSAIYRRSFMTERALRYRADTVYEDLSLSFRLRTVADTYVLVDEPLYLYRRDNPKSGTATIKDSMSVLEQYEEMFRWNAEHGLGLDKELKTMRFYSSLWAVHRVPGKENEFWDAASKLFREDSLDDEFFYRTSDYGFYCRVRDRKWI